MNGGAEGGKLAQYDAEIDRLTKEREEYLRQVQDPAERENRRKRREQLAGRWLVRRCRLTGAHVQAIGEVAGDEAWLFEAELMAADGWHQDEQGSWCFSAGTGGERGGGS